MWVEWKDGSVVVMVVERIKMFGECLHCLLFGDQIRRRLMISNPHFHSGSQTVCN